jgi:hypothetical protein
MKLRFAWVALLALPACGIVKIESAESKPTVAEAPESPSVDKTQAKEARGNVSDLQARLTAIVAEADATAAIDKLGELRLELLRRRRAALDALSDAERRQLSPQELSQILGAPAHALLRRIHHERARLYLKQNRPAEALAEVSVQGGGYEHAVLLECHADEDVCKEVHGAITKRYPGICAATYCSTHVDYLWNQASPAIVEVSISSVKKTPAGWLVTGGEFGPDTYTHCLDSFQTDKSLASRGTA